MLKVYFSMQEEDLIEHSNVKCHVFTFQYAQRKILLNILIPSTMYLHPQSTCCALCNLSTDLISILSILISTLMPSVVRLH